MINWITDGSEATFLVFLLIVAVWSIFTDNSDFALLRDFSSYQVDFLKSIEEK